jgi:hypothetical protein
MNKIVTEAHIIVWLSELGDTKAGNINLESVRRLAKMLYDEEYPESEVVRLTAQKEGV